jgi:photosystem II stability/assembly factor-like uncharacterized protein
LLLGAYRVYQTTNYGDTWTAISSPGANGWPSNITNPIDSIAIAASDTRTVYVAVNGHILVTFDSGATWQQRDIAGTVEHVAQVKVDPTNNLIAYAVRDRFDSGVRRGHVFRTADGGQTWADITGNLPDLPAYSLAIDPNSGEIYVGNDSGVYSSADLGATWSHFATGLPNVQVVELEWNPALNLLAAGTHGRGLWEILVGGSGGVPPRPRVNHGGISFHPQAVVLLLPETSLGQTWVLEKATPLASVPDATPAQERAAVDRVFVDLPRESPPTVLLRRKPAARHFVFGERTELLTEDRSPLRGVDLTLVEPE